MKTCLISNTFSRRDSPNFHTSLRWGFVFLERTWILSGIQFTTHFIEIFVVETKRFIGSFVHVILIALNKIQQCKQCIYWQPSTTLFKTYYIMYPQQLHEYDLDTLDF